ncbi:MAG: ABC transporter substrate-binding protein [Solirubrobacteraceae bacterium]
MRWARWMVGAIVAVAGAGLVAGCGASATADNHVAGRRLTVYVSVPYEGSSAANARAVLGGIEMALDAAHHRVRQYRIALRVLNDATAQSGGWDPGQTSANARRAAANPSTIAYIGEIDSGASAVSIPLLNGAGIPQISPTSTAIGLTTGGYGALPGEPEKYYPTQRRTFVRVAPDDAVQAAVQVQAQLDAGCMRTAVFEDGDVDGRDAALTFAALARKSPLHVIGPEQFAVGADDRGLAAAAARSQADCVLITGLDDHRAARLSERIAAAAPGAMLFGWSGLAAPAYIDPAAGGLPGWLAPQLVVTDPGLDAAQYPPAGRRFAVAYARHYGTPPPTAIYGYEAMSLLLDAIGRATAGGTREVGRPAVLAALLHTRDRHSVLGTYSIDGDGDTTLDRYGVYRVRNGRLVFWRALSR